MDVAACLNGHVVTVTEFGASQLMDACALIILASEGDPPLSLPPEMTTAVSELFLRLEQSAERPTPIDRYSNKRDCP